MKFDELDRRMRVFETVQERAAVPGGDQLQRAAFVAEEGDWPVGENYDKPGQNPQTGEAVLARRRQLKVELELPLKDKPSEFIGNLLNSL